MLKRVKLLGNRSQIMNPDGTHNVYPHQSRQGAKSLYEGAWVYVDHPERTRLSPYIDLLKASATLFDLGDAVAWDDTAKLAKMASESLRSS